MAYSSQLEGVPADSKLYEVYGLDAPPQLGGVEHYMGSLQLDGALTKSKFGDQNLFFRHQLSSDDMELKPEWTEYFSKYKGLFGSEGNKCPYKAMLEKFAW